MKYPRNKATIERSGIDPGMRELSKLHAIRSNQKKKYIKALESVEFYWERVEKAIDEAESSQSA